MYSDALLTRVAFPMIGEKFTRNIDVEFLTLGTTDRLQYQQQT